MRQYLCFLLTLLVAGIGPAVGSLGCEIKGTVRHADGSPSYASLVLAAYCPVGAKCPAEGKVYSTQSDRSGRFAFKEMPEGIFQVVIAHSTISWATHSFLLENNRIASIDATLPFHKLFADSTILFEKPTTRDLAEYEQPLISLDEDPLCSGAFGVGISEYYRFLWLRSGHEAVLISLAFAENGEVIATYKETENAGWENLGTLRTSKTINVRESLKERWGEAEAEYVDEYINSRSWISKDDFWELPYEIDNGDIVLDGAIWTIEGRTRDLCHVVSRHSPEEGDPFRNFAERIIWLIGKRFYDDEVY